MNIADWHAVLDSEPATPNQVGAILREFGRLGVADRAERLAISAALLSLDDLSSTTDLAMGEAGQLVRILRQTRDRGDLPEVTVTGDDDQADRSAEDGQGRAAVPGDADERDGLADEPELTFIESIRALILALAVSVCGGESRSTHVRADIGPERTRQGVFTRKALS